MPPNKCGANASRVPADDVRLCPGTGWPLEEPGVWGCVTAPLERYEGRPVCSRPACRWQVQIHVAISGVTQLELLA